MKVYISGCTRENKRIIEQTAKLLKSAKHEVSYYTLGTEYSPEDLEQSDAVVFVLPHWLFGCPLTDMTQGSLKELVYCLNNRKNIFISYYSTVGIRIYAAKITNTLCIQGIPATYMNLNTISEVIESLPLETKVIEKSTERFY